MKRIRHLSSEDSDNGRNINCRRVERRWREAGSEEKGQRLSLHRDRDHIWTFPGAVPGSSTTWSQHSHSLPRRTEGKRPSEVFRTDLITAMKLPDSFQLSSEDYCVLADPWRQEWEKGVQVPVSPRSIPQPGVRTIAEKGKEILFSRPKRLIRSSSSVLGYVGLQALAEGTCRYDLDEADVAWLHLANQELCAMGMPTLDELSTERVMEEFERRCYDNMSHAMETEEGLGIEYDEDVVCDVCLSPDGEDDNEMVFCDKCNICVHQACYGIVKVPEGSWLCRICALGVVPTCQLCPKKGGAMKPTRSGSEWIHVSCALWIPEVTIANPEKMEPITNVSKIPSNRWALLCCLCKKKMGACIQCCAKNCRTAFHVSCGLQAGLKMNTILTDADVVKFKASCPAHSGLPQEASGEEDERQQEGGARDRKEKKRGKARQAAGNPLSASPDPLADSSEGISLRQQEEKRVSLRKLKLQQLEEEFFKFVRAEEVAPLLRLPPELVDILFEYWKLKRRANFNQPLLTPRKDEEESLARLEQVALLRRLQLFTHLRQDLERVRNLTYMVTRREKIKRTLCRVQEQIFNKQVALLEHVQLAAPRSLRGHSGKTPEQGYRKRRRKGGHKRTPVTQHKLSESGPVSAKNRRTLRSADLRETRASGPDEAPRKTSDPASEQRRSGLRERSPVKTKPRVGPQALDNLPASEGASSTRVSSFSPVTKPNGLRRTPGGQTNRAVSRSAGSHLKNWGSFRIPRKSDRQDTPPQHKTLERTSCPTNKGAYPRTRLRTGAESDGYGPGVELGQAEVEHCEKRCYPPRLRGDGGPLSRRYNSDIIHRGVLVS